MLWTRFKGRRVVTYSVSSPWPFSEAFFSSLVATSPRDSLTRRLTLLSHLVFSFTFTDPTISLLLNFIDEVVSHDVRLLSYHYYTIVSPSPESLATFDDEILEGLFVLKVKVKAYGTVWWDMLLADEIILVSVDWSGLTIVMEVKPSVFWLLMTITLRRDFKERWTGCWECYRSEYFGNHTNFKY